MGAPTMARTTTGEQAPPSLATASKPIGGVAMPGLPTRPRATQDDEEDSGPHIPPPPRVQRSPTPPTPAEREESPVRIAMPVSRGKQPEIEAPEERLSPPIMPVRSMEKNLPDEEDLTEEPAAHDPARGAGVAMAEASFGQENAPSANQASQGGGKRAVVQYDYEKAEDNEIELIEGETITDIDLLDPDWYAGTNSKGERGLFPANYVELLEDEEEPAPRQPARHIEQEPAPSQPARHMEVPPSSTKAKPTATAIYDYEAAEDNELSLAEGGKITDLVSPLYL
jgi:drebrin-like protein